MYVYGNNKSYLHLFAGYILNYRNNKLSAIYLDTYILVLVYICTYMETLFTFKNAYMETLFTFIYKINIELQK